MPVERIEFLVEEPSMEAALRAMLPAWLGQVQFEIFPFQGKEDLLSKLPARLRGYSRYLPVNHKIFVLIDRDNAACSRLKQALEVASTQAGLSTRTARDQNGNYSVVNRIVIEELEAWYFGAWDAVRLEFPKIDSRLPRKAAYRDPDAIAGGIWEAFERVAQGAGYFKGGLRKVDAARKLGAHLSTAANTSRSFNRFREALQEVLALP